jgi:hypothetical protein
MRNVAQNGFACPMCRTVMAEEEPEEEEYSVISGDYSLLVDMRNPDDYALRGFRMFMDNVEGVEHDREDELEEAEDNEEPAKPSAAHIAQQLTANGVTMEDLVKILLRDHDEYEAEEEAYNRADGQIFGKIRSIIHNFNRRPTRVSVPPLDINVVTEFPPPVQQEPLVEIVDDSAQPKVQRPPRPYRSTIVYIDETIAN